MESRQQAQTNLRVELMWNVIPCQLESFTPLECGVGYVCSPVDPGHNRKTKSVAFGVVSVSIASVIEGVSRVDMFGI